MPSAAAPPSFNGNPGSPATQPWPVTPVQPAAQPDFNQAPSVYARSVLVMDAVTGRVLFQKNADEQRQVASTQKLMTALAVMCAGPLSDPVTVAHSDTTVEPTKIYVQTGETYERGYLLKALLVKSGNDIALSLARDVAGSKEAFSDLMNRTAFSLGMRHSRFQNPHGLTEPNQFSTARDMAILAREVLKYPYLRQCMQSQSMLFTFPDGRTKTLTNTNKVLKRLSYCTGMKTGTTNAAGRCLISSGTLNGRTVISVVLGSNSANVWDDSEKLLRWALE
ncbi:MAG: D-alanyl-D-alanine carboxypeptidase family protein [Verrucomicrobiales bacterium]